MKHRGAGRRQLPLFKVRWGVRLAPRLGYVKTNYSFKLPPAKTPLHKEHRGSPGLPTARPDLAPVTVLRIPTKWCHSAPENGGYHFRYANQNSQGVVCANTSY